jgi:hypothetical protein
MESIVGQTVSHYALLEKLGAGGMGEIYKARDSRLNRIVAVKVLKPGTTRDPERRRRFIQEAQAASALNHPNIVTIHDILPEGDTQYMVMEHVAGKTLLELIAEGRLPVQQALPIATQIANALAVAHAAGIIHRDLKPANVMVTGSGLVKILDFGLAKLLDPTAGLRSPGDGSSLSGNALTMTTAPLTVEGSIMGTLNYMSPEQAEGLKVDARSDIFSFGAVLYEMITGQVAFDGPSAISTLSAVLLDDVKPIPEIAPEVPAELNDIIAGCLRKKPADRWQSMSEVAAALNSLRLRLESAVSAPAIVSSSAPAAPASAVSSAARKNGTKKAVLIGVACLAIVALAAAGAWWQTHPRGTPPPVAITATPAPQTAPTPVAATSAIAPDAAAAEKTTIPAVTIPAVGAPPPPTPVVPFTHQSKTPVAPPVAAAKTPVQPQAVATPAAPLTAAPVPQAPAAPEQVTVTLNDGLPFRIALLEDIPADAEVGRALRFRVLDGVQSGGVVVIAKGTVVTGAVTALGGKRNFFGERSKVRFRLTSAESVDDNKIGIRATPASKSDGEDARTFEVPKGSKDKNLLAASGAEYVAYVAGDQTVTVHK